MPSQVSDDAFGQALLHSIQDGVYPEAEEVISAELPSSALPVILELLTKARVDVKVWNDSRYQMVLLTSFHHRPAFVSLAATPPPTSMGGSPKRSSYVMI